MRTFQESSQRDLVTVLLAVESLRAEARELSETNPDSAEFSVCLRRLTEFYNELDVDSLLGVLGHKKVA